MKTMGNWCAKHGAGNLRPGSTSIYTPPVYDSTPLLWVPSIRKMYIDRLLAAFLVHELTVLAARHTAQSDSMRA